MYSIVNFEKEPMPGGVTRFAAREAVTLRTAGTVPNDVLIREIHNKLARELAEAILMSSPDPLTVSPIGSGVALYEMAVYLCTPEGLAAFAAKHFKRGCRSAMGNAQVTSRASGPVD